MEALQALLSSGKTLLADTKQRKPPPAKPGKVQASKHTIAEAAGVFENDPHKLFIRRAIDEKPPRDKMVDEIKKFIKTAEELL
jgi:hypothetical protein